MNWREVYNYDVGDLISTSNVKSMENILDHVTFAKLDIDQINNASPDNILKVFLIFQCGVEYLLYCQQNLVGQIDEYEQKLRECYSVFTKMSHKLKEND